MERRRRSFVVVCLTLTLAALCDSAPSTASSTADGHHDNSDDAINAARCRVRCLSLLQVAYAVNKLILLIGTLLRFLYEDISRDCGCVK